MATTKTATSTKTSTKTSQGSQTTTVAPRFAEGQLVHTEFITKNAKELASFLSKQFGWKVDSMPMPGGSGGEYHVFTAPGGAAGGIAAPQPNAPAGTFAYIAVKDIKATSKKLEQAGATLVVPPTEIPGMGWFCHWTYKGSPPIACFQGTHN